MPMNKLLVSLLLTLGTFGVVHAEGAAGLQLFVVPVLAGRFQVLRRLLELHLAGWGGQRSRYEKPMAVGLGRNR